MKDVAPNAPRIVTLRDPDGVNLGFAIRVKQVVTLQDAKIGGGYQYTSRGIRDVEAFRARDMFTIVTWLDHFYTARPLQVAAQA